MSPSKEISSIKHLGIIAGAGDLPAQLVSTCLHKNITPHIVAIKGHAHPDLVGEHSHFWSGLGSVGKVIKFFKDNDVRDLVMIGSVKRPSLTELKPDLKTIKIISKIGLKMLGDDGLLSALKQELMHEGFNVHGIQDFCENLLLQAGPLGKVTPLDDDIESINHGLKISQAIGALDIGQSVVVQNGVILGVEGVEGTDALITRCGELKKAGRGPILVKTCKPQQDKALDLPTIGQNTVQSAYDAGFSGIIAHTDNVLITDSKMVAQYADQYKIFVVGMNPDTLNLKS